MMESEARLRIGELGRRVGVAPERLRAWERRYGLLEPARSQGGFRLYSARDEERIRRMQRYLEEGISAAEAAERVLIETSGKPGDAGEAPATVDVRLPELRRQMRMSLEAFDESGSHRVIDRLLAAYRMDTVLSEAVLPYLHDLGERWARGEATVGQEHFASNLLRSRLLSLGSGWGQSSSRRAILSCAPGELHEFGLIAFGLALAARGWGITYLGIDTPVDQLQAVGEVRSAELVAVSAVTEERFLATKTELRELGETTQLAIGGAGASAETAATLNATLLGASPVEAAQRLETAGD